MAPGRFRRRRRTSRAGYDKNRDGQGFPLNDEVRAVLEAQRAVTTQLQRRTGRIIPWVFPTGKARPSNRSTEPGGRPVDAGVLGRVPHDFRRTAVRNLERAGVSRSVAMKLTGHKTEAVYRRYAIVSEADLHEGVAKVGRALEPRMAARKLAEGEGFEPPRGLRPGGFQVPAPTESNGKRRLPRLA
jgi:integrase